MAWIRRYKQQQTTHAQKKKKKKKTTYFQNFSWFQFYVFKLCMIRCFIAPIDYCVELSLVYKTFCENCSHFILKWFQPYSFWGIVLLRGELQKYAKKFKFWQFWECLYSALGSVPFKSQIPVFRNKIHYRIL